MKRHILLNISCRFILVLVLVLANWRPAGAATVLFDFESQADLAAMHDERQATLGPGKTLERVPQFATSGRFALKFATPRWVPGKPQWPAFECQPPVTNWSGFDRLTFTVVNPGEHPQMLALFISDSKVSTREGLSYQARLAPFSYTLAVVPLSQLAEKKVNPADLRVMHFYTSEPPGDMAIFMDSFTLLRAGESTPALPGSFHQELAAMQARKVEDFRATIAAARSRLQPVASTSPVVADWTAKAFAALDERVAKFQAAVARADGSALDADSQLASLPGELSRLESLAAFRAGFEKLRGQLPAATAPRADLAIGFATSMEKVLPRHGALNAVITNRVAVSLARNEKESFQVLVLACESALKGVRARITDLRSETGAVLAATNLQAVPVGYVQTKATPPYGSPHAGWWPDPILDFLTTADVAQGDVQSFWVRVRAPKQQPPGNYTGKVEMLVDGAPAFTFELAVRVYPFTLPDRSPLPLAITFSPEDNALPETQEEQKVWRQSEDYPVNAWKRHTLRWADFLADYYITMDSLYHSSMPRYEALTQLHQQGRLGPFNLGYYGHVGSRPEDFEQWKSSHFPRYRAAYDKARELGLLDHAYIYGCDEAVADLFPLVQKAAAALKAEFPGVPVMTTTYDQSYGMQSVIKSMDAFCPLTPSFDPAKAAQARAAGKQVWWYICCGPHHPHLNMFIEYPAIEGRLLMGAMTTKYRPDGFLYYQISIWNSRKSIEFGPFTDWDPRSWTTYHGDGSWTCAGPGGTPLATVRLENFRDGLEDYAYARLLETAIAKVNTASELRDQKAEWLKQAKALLEVPAEVMKSKTEYTQDPAALYRYRARLAEAIIAAGVNVELPNN